MKNRQGVHLVMLMKNRTRLDSKEKVVHLVDEGPNLDRQYRNVIHLGDEGPDPVKQHGKGRSSRL